MRSAAYMIVVLLLGIANAVGEVPPLINSQGKLTNASGAPVPNGSYSIRFRIYSAETGGDGSPCRGTCVWEEIQSVSTQQGIYSVLLGSVNPLSSVLFSEPNRFIGIKVGSDAEMIPRHRTVYRAIDSSGPESGREAGC